MPHVKFVSWLLFSCHVICIERYMMCVDEEEPMLVLMQAQKCIGLLYQFVWGHSQLQCFDKVMGYDPL